MQRSDSIKELAGALAKAQAAFEPIHRDKTVTVKTRTGGSYSFSYAPLETIMASIRKPLAEHDLALLQEVVDGKVVTSVLHASGEWFTSGGTPVKVVEEGPQAYGSALTYARRYDVSLTFGLTPDDDDDGNAAEGNEATAKAKNGNGGMKITPRAGAKDNITPEQRQRINGVVHQCKEWIAKGSYGDAVVIADMAELDADEHVYFWDQFDSKDRAAMTKEHKAQIQKRLVREAPTQA